MPAKIDSALDDRILKKIGLTDDELSTMQATFNAFAKSLDKAQLQSLKTTLPSAKKAAASLGPEVTAEYLEKFIRAHAPPDASVVLINCTSCHHP